MIRFPLIRNLPQKTNFGFTRFARLAAFFSIGLVVLSFVSFYTGGLRNNPITTWQQAEGSPLDRFNALGADAFNLGIDFAGGSLLEVAAPEPIDLAAVRESVGAMNLGDLQVQSFDDPRGMLLRFESPRAADPSATIDRVKAELREVIPNARFVRVEVVGPKVSGELFISGIIAIALAILIIVVYIWLRFEWRFGIGGVLALFHDVILTLGLFSLIRLEFTLTIVAAIMTIAGYSMNDTVVVFDRIRENLRKYKKMPLDQVIDLSMNETFSRTIITGVTSLLALAGLLIVGGEALQGFAIAMIFGIVIGTYSSIYVASPALLLWGVKRAATDKTEAEAAKSAMP